MFEFYSTMFKLDHLDQTDVHEAASWGVIDLVEYKKITGEEFIVG